MITKRDKYFIELAFAQAISIEKAGGARIGAAIVLKNKVISFGRNKNKTHPFQLEYAKKPEALYLHAENDAINNDRRELIRMIFVRLHYILLEQNAQEKMVMVHLSMEVQNLVQDVWMLFLILILRRSYIRLTKKPLIFLLENNKYK